MRQYRPDAERVLKERAPLLERPLLQQQIVPGRGGYRQLILLQAHLQVAYPPLPGDIQGVRQAHDGRQLVDKQPLLFGQGPIRVGRPVRVAIPGDFRHQHGLLVIQSVNVRGFDQIIGRLRLVFDVGPVPQFVQQRRAFQQDQPFRVDAVELFELAEQQDADAAHPLGMGGVRPLPQGQPAAGGHGPRPLRLLEGGLFRRKQQLGGQDFHQVDRRRHQLFRLGNIQHPPVNGQHGRDLVRHLLA